MLALMDRHPEFLFNQSTAQLYAYLEEDDPALFARIKEKVAAGQWEPNGAMWVEPDTNMPTGESFVRQLLYGQRYFERTFGSRHTVCWLPDCFGFSPALPQLLNQAGVTSFFTIKVNWSETNAMPHDLFWWEGLDGSRVLAHTFNNPVGGYNAETGARAILETWKNYRGKHAFPESLLAFGYGDGGGGPTEEMLDRQRQFADFPAVPALRPVKVADWFAEAHAARRRGPRAAGLGRRDLPRAPPRHADHPGPHQVPAPPRRTGADHRRDARQHGDAPRRAARRLARAAVAGAPAQRVPRHPARLQHPRGLRGGGSGARRRRRRGRAHRRRPPRAPSPRASCRPATGPASSSSTPTSRRARSASSRPTRSPAARRSPAASVLAGRRPVPGLTAAVILEAPAPAGVSADGHRLENELLRVEVDAGGALASVFDKRAGREALAERGNQIWAYVDKPRNWDAWDIEDTYARQGEEIAGLRDRGGRDAARTARRSASPAASATARSCRPTGSGPTPPGSRSPPTSTGTSGASC